MSLEKDYDLEAVAEALGMSTRWVRERVKEGAEHQRYGHKIRFPSEQVDKLKAAHVKVPVDQSITTGRKRRAS
jgi:DNA-binding Lrp family transcriptional regulator